VFSLGKGGAVLEAIAAHASRDRIRTRTGFDFTEAANLELLSDPPAHALAAIHALDPDNLRGELVAA
jgi:hypothetical protein